MCATYLRAFAVFLALLFVIAINVSAKENAADSLWKIYNKSGENRVLLYIADISQAKGNIENSDSLIAIALEQAVLENDQALLMDLYALYFQKGIVDLNKATEYSKHIQSIVQSSNNDVWLYESFKAQARVSIAQNNWEKALELINRAYYHVTQTGNEQLKAACLLLQGSCLEKLNRKVEAFRNYMDALYLAEKNKDRKLKFQCYAQFSTFFFLINNIDKAKEYKLKQISFVLQHPSVDSVMLMNLYNDLGAFFLLNHEWEKGRGMIDKVIGFAGRTQNQKLIGNSFAILRTNLINEGKFKDLARLYQQEYPKQLAYLKENESTLYLRIQAFIQEANGEMEAAASYYKQAEEKIITETYDANFLANFYKRYGEFLLRWGRAPEAERHFRIAYGYAKAGNYLPFMIEATKLLDSVNYLMGNMTAAYDFARLQSGYSEELAASAKEEELLRLEIDTEAKKRELELARETEQTIRRHNLQYLSMTFGLTTSFIILAVLGSFKVNRIMIKAMGFFTFIFFFEFIILLADKEIHHATHGEPWKIMGLKILLIAVLYPLHHYVEEKVVRYLTNHKLIDSTKLSLKWWKKKPVAVSQVAEKDPLINN